MYAHYERISVLKMFSVQARCIQTLPFKKDLDKYGVSSTIAIFFWYPLRKQIKQRNIGKKQEGVQEIGKKIEQYSIVNYTLKFMINIHVHVFLKDSDSIKSEN